MYQTIRVPHPDPCGPWSLCACKLAKECQQIYQNVKDIKFNASWRVDYLSFVPFSRSEILEIIPTILKSSWLVIPVSNRRELVNAMKVILDCPGS